MDYIRKMQKRGRILIVLGIFLIVYAILTSAQTEPMGCCTNPDYTIGVVCTQMTADECCAGDSACEASYFYEGEECDSITFAWGFLCAPEGGTCLGEDPIDEYCEFFTPLALCTDQTNVSTSLPEELPECTKGCCICEKAGDKFVDPIPGNILKTSFECDNFCAGFSGYVVDTFDTTITDENDCIGLISITELSNISGTISDFTGPLQGATVVIAGKTATTDASGSYRIEDITAGTGIQTTVSLTNYLDNITTIDLVPGENTYDFTLQSVQMGTLEGTVTSSIAPAGVDGVSILIAGKTKRTDANGFYQITGIPYGEYLLVTSNPAYDTFTETIIINQSLTTEDITLIPKEFASLTGTIASAVEPYDAIGNAEITLSGSLGTFTAISESREIPTKGFYRISDIPASPGNQYTLRVRAEGFEPYSSEIISFSKGVVLQEDINLVPIVLGCGVTDCTPPLDFKVEHVLGEEKSKISWQSPCNTVIGFDVIRDDGKVIPVSALASKTYYTINDTDVSWGETYTYDIIAYYPESDCKQSDITADTTDEITLGDSICEGRYDKQARRWIGFCDGEYLRKRCDDQNIVQLDGSGGQPGDCSTIAPLGDYYCSGPDKFGLTYCKNKVGCGTANIPPFGICPEENQISCWGANVPSESSANYCFLDQHPSFNQFDTCRSCTEVDSCFSYTSKLACELDSSTCLKASGSICKWESTTTESYEQGFCYQDNYQGTDRCSLCNYAQSPTIGVECTQDICSLLGDCYAVDDIINIATGETKFVSCKKCEAGTTTCEDFKTEEECTGGEAIHFADNGCTVVNSNDRCGLGACKWSDAFGCFKDGNLDNLQDCSTPSCLKDTEPPLTTVTQDDNPHIVVSIINNSVSFTTNETISKIEYCITTYPDVCCSFDIIDELPTPTVKNLKEYLEDKGIENTNNNTYYLKYWATDVNFNREQTKTKQITADIKEPEIDVYHKFDFFGIADTASLEININVNERVDCTDSLTGTGVSESRMNTPEILDIDQTKTVVYEDLPEDTYTYSITCIDKVGNTKTETKTIAVIKPFITLVTPEPVTDDLGFVFRIKTLREATCTLTGLGSDEEFIPDDQNILQLVLAGDEKLYLTRAYDVGGGEIEPNLYHDFAEVRCIEPGAPPISHERFLEFTTDRIGPETEFTAINFNNQRFSKDNLPTIGFDRTINVELKCRDLPINPSTGREVGFKCKETKWCETDKGGDCDPSTGNVYDGLFPVESSKTICYQSWDNGIKEAYQGEKLCVDLTVAEPLVINLLAPKTEEEIDGNEVVLNIPNFDIVLKTAPEVSDCRFALSSDFDYDAATPEFIFNKIGQSAIDWIYPDYPSGYRNTDFTLTPDPITGKIFNNADMYIKCALLGTGEVLPTLPRHYKFIYDPTPPNITEFYATTESDGTLINDPLMLLSIQDVYLRVDTDDKTTCRYSNLDSDYGRMDSNSPGIEGVFDAHQSDGTYTTKHIVRIDKTKVSTNLQEYKYYVACKNRAGDISETKTISFTTNHNQERIITSTKIDPILAVVSGKQIINNSKYSQLGGVLLTVSTSHETVGCYYSGSPDFNFNTYNNGSFPQLFKPGTLTHITSDPVSVVEGNYNYKVICLFTIGDEKQANINFVKDDSPPTILNVTVSDSGDICSDTRFSPEFDVEDPFSGVKEYSYRLLKVTTPITNWTTTNDQNPDITGLNLTIGDTYRIEVKATDYVGKESSSKTEEFKVLDPNSFECVGDDTPPTITINETIVGTMIEVDIGCNDKFGCFQTKYGYSTTSSNCDPNAYPYYSTIQLFTLPTYLCYNASDNNGNIATGIKYIAINDTDGDGVGNKDDNCPDTPAAEIYSIEYDESSPNYGCGPSEIDSDGDMLPDFWEEQYNTETCLLDMNSTDSNTDGVSDADEDCDDDGKNNYFEYLNGLDPTVPDLADEDNDGVVDDLDNCPATPFGETVDEFGCGDSQKDTDGDGMDDKWEKTYGLDYTDPTDADEDKDGDKLTNLEEYGEGTDPTDEDTDGDEYGDKKEIDKGFDPLDASSFPPSAPIFAVLIIILIIILLLGGAGYFAYMYRTQIEDFITEKVLQKPVAPKRPTIPTRPSPARPTAPLIRKPTGPSPEEIRRRQMEEIRRKRIAAKQKRRSKAFEIFGAEKIKTGKKAEEKIIEKAKKEIYKVPSIKPEEKKVLKPLAKVIQIPERKEEFERLARLTEEHLTKGRPLESLIKITRIPKGKEDEFEKLTELIKRKVKLPETKKKKELTKEQKEKIRDVFSQLSSLAPKRKITFEKLNPKKREKTFEELENLSKRRKKR